MSKSRFSWRFRILNFLSGDYLRNYLAVGVGLYLTSAVETLDSASSEESKLRRLEFYIRRAKHGLDDVFHI